MNRLRKVPHIVGVWEMRRKEIQVLIAVIHIVSKRYPKDKDVQLICDAFEKVLMKLEGKS